MKNITITQKQGNNQKHKNIEKHKSQTHQKYQTHQNIENIKNIKNIWKYRLRKGGGQKNPLFSCSFKNFPVFLYVFICVCIDNYRPTIKIQIFCRVLQFTILFSVKIQNCVFPCPLLCLSSCFRLVCPKLPKMFLWKHSGAWHLYGSSP